LSSLANAFAVVGMDGEPTGAPAVEIPAHGPAADRAVSLLLDSARAAVREAGAGAGAAGDAGRTGLFLACPAVTAATSGLAATAARGLDLRGPSIAVADPGSAALAAVHRACLGLRDGECDLALAAEAAEVGATAAVLAIERLPDALAAGHRIRAVIRGTAGPDGTATAGPLPDALAAPDLASLILAVLAVELGALPAGGIRRSLVSAPGGGGGAAADLLLEQPPALLPPRRAEAGAAEQDGAPPCRRRERPALANDYDPPANHLEAAIAGVWQEQLGIDRVGVHDNFFELGGTSILGIRIIALLKEWLHQEIPTLSLYEGPTVSALTRLLLHGDGEKAETYDDVRERGERRRRKLQRLTQPARQSAAE